MNTLNIHDIVKDVTSMRLASQVIVTRLFKNESVAAIIDELNWYLETQELPYRIEQAKGGRLPYLNLEGERLDRVLYFLSLIIKKPLKKPVKGVIEA